LVDSNVNIDQHDIPGFGSSILQVVFPQDDGSTNADFFSNYQSFDGDADTKRNWTFTIKNQQKPDLKNAPITISLPSIQKVTYKKVKGQIIYDKKELLDNDKKDELTLIDVDNNTVYTVNQLETANLTMQGLHTRTFAWEMGTSEPADYVAPAVGPEDVNIATNFATETNNISTDSTNSFDAPRAGGKFGLPPQ